MTDQRTTDGRTHGQGLYLMFHHLSLNGEGKNDSGLANYIIYVISNIWVRFRKISIKHPSKI